MNKIFGIKKNVLVHEKGISLLAPNQLYVFSMIKELFLSDIYKNLKGCNHVLDLGGFIGETALYFSKYNDKVTVYEADIDNYNYILKNIDSNHNIKSYNLAVNACGGKIIFSKSFEHDPGGSSIINAGEKTFEINAISLEDILNNFNDIDGIKIDIEGSEYDILSDENKYYLFNKIKKGYIEFHYCFDNKNYITIFQKFIKFLLKSGYIVGFYDTSGKIVNYQELFEKQIGYFTIYFEII